MDFCFTGVGYSYNRPQLKTTARVLPGGQLQLADDQPDGPEPLPHRPLRRPSSWHGKTLDMVDFILDGYDVIDNKASSNVDSMSVSHNSILTSSVDTWIANSLSDDGIEVDIEERLSEYTIIHTCPESVDGGIQNINNKHGGERSEQLHRKLEKRCSNSTLKSYDENISMGASDSKFATESTFSPHSGFHHSGSFSAGSDNST